MDPEEAEAELAHFRSVASALLRYEVCTHALLLRPRARELALLEKTAKENAALIAPKLRAHATAVARAVRNNQKFLHNAVHVDGMFSDMGRLTLPQEKDGHGDLPLDVADLDFGPSGVEAERLELLIDYAASEVSGSDVEKVRSTLRQIARDWSSQGEEERRACYGPLLDAVDRHVHPLLPVDLQGAQGAQGTLDLESDEAVRLRSQVRVLCPGSGLGRLPFEFVRRGVSAQGNEFSAFMLIVGNCLLNHSSEVDQWELFPYATQVSNVVAYADAVRAVCVPDVVPAAELGALAALGDDGPAFEMCAGEFVEVYRTQPCSFDAVTTSFFIDTAHDVVEYIRLIFSVLKPGGIWANIGPLLWHYEEISSERSVEVPWEAVKDAILGVGFEMLEEDFPRRCQYTDNRLAMMHTTYDTVFFVCKKPTETSP